MSKSKRIFSLIALAAVIWRAGLELHGISWQYVQEAQVKESLISYREDAASDAEVNLVIINDEMPPAGYLREEDIPAEAPETPVDNPIIADLQKEVNEDIAGWLTVPGTQIDYPLVSAKDNSTYLETDVYGNPAKAGTLFTDRRCTKDFSGFNTIIYGHHMKNGSMFGELKFFADKDFFEANQFGELMTIDNTYTLEFFAYIVVQADDKTVYNTAPEREEFHEYVKQNARNFREPERGWNVVTLSTCSYEFEGARIVLLATINPEH